MINIKTFNDLINELNKLNNTQKGRKFEEICKQVLQKSAFFSNEVKDVWLWNEFPFKNNEHDTGIDIVVKDINDEFWSIQCKCYDDKHIISKSEIDKFIARSSIGFQIINNNKIERNILFSRKYIFTTSTIGISKNLKGYEITYFNYKNFEDLDINWSECDIDKEINLKIITKKKFPRDYQRDAINSVIKGFKENDRGQLIMACGSGKTFTSLKIVEEFINENNISEANILYLVPSIPLLSQTITEWKIQIDRNKINNGINNYAICSDPTSTSQSKKYKNINEISEDNEDDYADISLPIPATTDINKLKFEITQHNKNNRHNFFFCTYQSINVIIELQKQIKFKFDLVICDEAHRTFGVKIEKYDKTNTDFKKVHDNKNIDANKRLYMTATPKVFAQKALSSIKKHHLDNEYNVYSMDNKDWFGPIFYRLTFGQAISKGILTDYRIIGLRVNKNKLIESNIMKEASIDNAAKIWALISGLSKNSDSKFITSKDNPFYSDPYPSLKSVVFTNYLSQADKIADIINKCSLPDWYGSDRLINNNYVVPQALSIKGSDSSYIKNEKLDWLKSDDGVILKDNSRISKILTNARCLTEGVDVPALDSIAFLERKTSQIDIIQACGRVMRKSQRLIAYDEYEDKKYGYIIVPIVVEKDTLDDDEINNNEDYKLLLRVIRALRSHDERLDNELNKMPEGGNLPPNICLVNSYIPQDEYSKSYEKNTLIKDNKYNISNEQFKKQEGVFDAYIYKYVGNREYLDVLFKDIGDIVNNISNRINNEISLNKKLQNKFTKFIKGLRKVINPWLSELDAINMLSQHIVIAPFLKSIFNEENLLSKNLVYILMDGMYKELDFLSEETENLKPSYTSIDERIKSINDNKEKKQQLIKDLFEKFFKYVDTNISEKNGVVYTPIEIVDFIINSVDDILNREFGQNLLDKNVKILEPFCGTGTFITRLLNKIKLLNATNDQIKYKYENDIWCNEIMLLSYYISLINIEYTYNEITNDILDFKHCVFTDTFQIDENIKSSKQVVLELNEFRKINELVEEENKQKIKVIISNPPYFVTQSLLNNNNEKVSYEILDNKIKNTYAKGVHLSTSLSALYDSYIRAYRWATDRINDNGIVAFITNGGFLENRGFLGFRRELINDFNQIYVYDLLGNFRKFNDKTQGQNVFGQSCGTRVCIIFLIKNNKLPKDGFIRYLRIGDGLKTKEKLDEIKNWNTILNRNIKFEFITPNKNNDWLNQGVESFYSHIKLCKVKKNIYDTDEKSIFGTLYSFGVKTENDLWRMNFSLDRVKQQDDYYLKIYNEALVDWCGNYQGKSYSDFKKFLSDNNYRKIQWTGTLEESCFNKKEFKISNNYRKILFKPFVKKYINLNQFLAPAIYKIRNIFPNEQVANRAINVLWMSGETNFCALGINTLPNYGLLSPRSQSFPYIWYEDGISISQQSSLLLDNDEIITINESIVKEFVDKYHDKNISYEDIFNYIYAVFQSSIYKTKYASNIMKEIPRIPYLDDFWGYSNIGKELLYLHMNYEQAPLYKDVKITIDSKLNKNINDLTINDYRIIKIKIDKNDKSKIYFNNNITIENIPLDAYDYKVCGRSPIDWVISEYKIEINNDYSYEIINDPNEYDPEKGGKYVFDLILSLITLSLKTSELIKQLPEYKEI